jgi:hypothetical protein
MVTGAFDVVELPEPDVLVVGLLDDEPHAATTTARKHTSAAATGRTARN